MAVTEDDRARLIAVATKYLYVREIPKGSNRSPEIDRWAGLTGAPLGSPWCADEQVGVADEAVGLDAFPFPHSGRVQDWVDRCKAEGRTTTPENAQPGDYVAFYFESLGRYGHIGLVEENTGSAIVSIDGNTVPDHDPGDQREGYGSFVKHRPYSDRMLILTWPA